MRVLVTGHDGYLGSVIVPVLRDAGHVVVGLDSYLFRGCRFGPAPVEGSALELDVRDVAARHLAGFDAVVHLAALSNDPLGDLSPEQTFAINHHASVRLARLAKDAGVERFLYSSSCSLYGCPGPDEPVGEDAPLRPLTAYAESKARTEDDLHELADAGFSPVYLRNATVYGPSPRLRVDLVVNDLVAAAFLTGEARVLSDGTPWRPVVHVADVASAFLAVLEAPREAVHDQALNVGADGDNHRVIDLAEIVREAVPRCRVAVLGTAEPDQRSYRVDFSKLARRVPGFRPQWTARAGAADLYRRYGALQLTAHDAAVRFRRVAWIKRLRAQGRLDESMRWSGAAGARRPAAGRAR